MANHKSALKRTKQDEVKKIRNMGYKTRAKKVVKEVRAAISEGSQDKANETLNKAVSVIQKCASKGAIHRKKASRKISRLSRQINQIASA